jgi:hypothetical protein
MTGPAYGCKELVPLCSTTPCPSAKPRLSAHSSRDRDAALCLKGKECAPCTLAPHRSHRRMRVGKLAIRIISVCHSGWRGNVCASHSSRVYLFPPAFMKIWLGGIIRRRERNPIDDLQTAAVFSDMDIRVDLKERPLPCGHLAYFAVVYRFDPEVRDWYESAVTHESDLDRVIRLLQEAQAYVEDI